MAVLLLESRLLGAARLPCLCGSPRPVLLLLPSLLLNYCHATPLSMGE